MSKNKQDHNKDELKGRKRDSIDVEKIRRSAQKVKRLEEEFLKKQNNAAN